MKKAMVGAMVFAGLAAFMMAPFLMAQREAVTPLAGAVQMEVHSVFPHEYSPGLYHQVDQAELQRLAQQGWELVSVMPDVYRKEEHGGTDFNGPKPVVTQTYPAYFFKRVRAVPARRE
jgi:hypothetical protein